MSRSNKKQAKSSEPTPPTCFFPVFSPDLWTDQIHEEWIRNVLKNRQDLAREQLKRTKGLMNSKVRDRLVADYEWLISSLQLPDLDDQHVLADGICR